MRIAMLGAGAMGSVFGGQLAAAGNDVVLINVDEDYVSTVNTNGLVLEKDAVESVVSVQAEHSTAHLQRLCQNKPPCPTACRILASGPCLILYPFAISKPALRSSNLQLCCM